MLDGILVINAGSSSIKFSLYASEPGAEPKVASKGQVEGIGTKPHFIAKSLDKKVLAEKYWDDPKTSHSALLGHLIDWVRSHHTDVALKAAGHRVVHGGTRFSAPTVIDEVVLEEIERLIPLAPLHNPHNLTPIRALRELFPTLPQVACFDTAFHRTMPRIAQMYAIPRKLTDEGVVRYGFHGSSFEYVAHALNRVAPDVAKGKVVVAHLGSGASMCGMVGGKSQITTMGLTPLDGLVMGTRPGRIDPGVLLHLMQQRGMSVTEVDTLLNKKSGILGVSEISNDFRDVEFSDDPRAKEAMDLVIYRIIQETGSIMAAIGGIDAMVYTAGVGEHSPHIRGLVSKALAWLGIELDEAANDKDALVITKPTSKVKVLVIPTDEELMIAMHTRKALNGAL